MLLPHCYFTVFFSAVVFASSHFLILFFFFFNHTATTEIYTLSLHDALPISSAVSAHPHSERRPGVIGTRPRHSGRPPRQADGSARHGILPAEASRPNHPGRERHRLCADVEIGKASCRERVEGSVVA